MTISITAATQTGDLVETNGVVTGVANVEQSFTTGVMNELMTPLNGGKTFTTGLGKTVAEFAKGYVFGLAYEKIGAAFGKDPYAWAR